MDLESEETDRGITVDGRKTRGLSAAEPFMTGFTKLCLYREVGEKGNRVTSGVLNTFVRQTPVDSKLESEWGRTTPGRTRDVGSPAPVCLPCATREGRRGADRPTE